jgi:CRP-like cAMP-binding protein
MSKRFDLADLPPELHEQIVARNLEAGESLFHEGDPVQALYYLESGQVRLVNYTQSGRIVNHYVVMAGEFVAEILVILDRCACTAIVEEPARVRIIPKQAWLATLRRYPDLAIAFMGELSYRLHMAKITMQLRGIRSASERVLTYLQIVVPPKTNIVVLDSPFKEIARDLDLTPETLSRSLAQLQESGLISRENGQIILHA